MIQRVFLGWDEPLLHLAARFLCDRYGVEGVVDLRQVCVVVPGGRGGRRLKAQLLNEALRRSLRLVPPRVVKAGALAELFYSVDWPVGSDLLRKQVWSAVLRDANPASLAGLAGDLPDQSDMTGWSLLGAKVATLHRETAGGGHTFRDVARICGSGELSFDDSERWYALAAIQEEYRDRLTGMQVVDPDLARIERFAKGRLGTEMDVWLIGIVDLPAVVGRIVAASNGQIGALVHAPETEAAYFDGLGLVDAAAWAGRTLDVPDDKLRVADRPGDQAAMAVEAIARLGEVRSEEVVIAQTSASLVPHLREWLESAGLPVHYAGGRPMESSRPYRLLAAVQSYLREREWEDLAGLARHPDLAVWLGRHRRSGGIDASPQSLDRQFSEHLPAHFRRPASANGDRARLEAVPKLIDTDLLGPLLEPMTMPLAAWAERILGVLATIYSAIELSSRTAEERRVVAVLGGIRSVALELHRLPPDLAPMCRAADALGILLDEIRTVTTPEEPDGAPIEILGWLELAMDDAPHAIVVGVNEGDLPESVNAHPFLPDRLRTRLGLQDNDLRYARDAFHLTALLHSRESVALISGRLSADGDPLRPSRLLLGGRGEALARRIIVLTGGAEREMARESPLIRLAGEHSHFSLPPVPELTFDPPARLRVTDFKAILTNPYRWVLERVLGLESVDDAAREMDSLAFGSLAHQVLARFGVSAERHSTDTVAIARRLDALLDEAVHSRFGPNSFPAVHLQVESLRRRLGRFAQWQAQRTLNGWRLMFVEGASADGDAERATVGTAAALDVDGVPMLLGGRIDRIDYHATTGRWALLDYKTGNTVAAPEKAHRKASTGDWKDLQLPLYRHLAAAMTEPDGGPLIPSSAPLDLGYICIPKDLAKIGDALASWTPADFESADNAARDVIRWLREGRARFDPENSATWSGDPYAALFGSRLLVAASASDGPGESLADGVAE